MRAKINLVGSGESVLSGTSGPTESIEAPREDPKRAFRSSIDREAAILLDVILLALSFVGRCYRGLLSLVFSLSLSLSLSLSCIFGGPLPKIACCRTYTFYARTQAGEP